MYKRFADPVLFCLALLIFQTSFLVASPNFIAPNSAKSTRTPSHISRISMSERSDGLGVVIRIHSQNEIVAYAQELTSIGHKIYLYNTTVDPNIRKDEILPPILSWQIKPENQYVVLTYALDPNRSVNARVYRDADSNDLLISLVPQNQRVSTPILVDSTPLNQSNGNQNNHSSNTGTDSNQQTTDPNRSSQVPPADNSSSTNSSTFVPSSDPRVIDIIAIDAGHGGNDPGGIGNGVTDKAVALAVALKLGKYLEERLGVHVVYTRKDDRFIPLEARGRIANEAGAKLFISLHGNTLPGRSNIHGTETYILGLHLTDEAEQVMERENSVIRLEENQEIYDGFGQQSLIFNTLAQGANLQNSEKLGGLIELEFKERAGRRSRGVKQAGMFVLWNASMPAVLVELGYLTNQNEARFLDSAYGQDLMASAIFRAVRAYKQDIEGSSTSSN